MPHPKRRHSVSRRDKRRSSRKLTVKTISICPTTDEPHILHRAHWSEGKMYYKGKVVLEKVEK
jgi:large subunit ribosomal protein L32